MALGTRHGLEGVRPGAVLVGEATVAEEPVVEVVVIRDVEAERRRLYRGR